MTECTFNFTSSIYPKSNVNISMLSIDGYLVQKKIDAFDLNLLIQEQTRTLNYKSITKCWDVFGVSKSLDKLARISRLKNNWDYSGARKISRDSIRCAEEIIHSIPIQPNIIPSKKGYVVLEFGQLNNSFVSFSIFNRNSIEMFFRDRNSSNSTMKTLNIEQLVGLLCDKY